MHILVLRICERKYNSEIQDLLKKLGTELIFLIFIMYLYIYVYIYHRCFEIFFLFQSVFKD